MSQNPDAPSTEERYVSATQTSSLKVVAERGGAGDVLISAGWSPHRVGLLLLRLRSEWDAMVKPQRSTPRPVRAGLTGKDALDDAAAAALEADQWFQNEVLLARGRLKSLFVAQTQLTGRAMEQGSATPETLARRVLSWWLDPTCPTCEGRRWQTIPGTARLSAKACPTCSAVGQAPCPGGMQGAQLYGWMSECLGFARAAVAKRLRADRNST